MSNIVPKYPESGGSNLVPKYSTGGGGGGITDITNSDERLTITGMDSKVIDVSSSQIAEIVGKCNNFVTVADEAAMLAVTPATVGSTVVSRTDRGGMLYQLTASPATTLGNWRNIGETSSSAPYVQSISITADAQTHNITPPAASGLFIVYLNFTADVLLVNLTIAASAFTGVMRLVNSSTANASITTKITYPDTTSAYISVPPSSTYTYFVTTADTYVSAQVPQIIVNLQSATGENVPLTGITTIDGQPMLAGGTYLLSSQTPDVTHGVNGLYVATSSSAVTLTHALTDLPVGTTMYVIGGSTNAAKTLTIWQDTANNPAILTSSFNIPVVADTAARDALPVASNSFAFVQDSASKGIYAKIAGVWESTTSATEGLTSLGGDHTLSPTDGPIIQFNVGATFTLPPHIGMGFPTGKRYTVFNNTNFQNVTINPVPGFNDGDATPFIVPPLGSLTFYKDGIDVNWLGCPGVYADTGLALIKGGIKINNTVVSSTKTKITYNAQGLVTAGANATTADIASSTDKRYVTDAQLAALADVIYPASQDLSAGDVVKLSGAGTVASIYSLATTGNNIAGVGDAKAITSDVSFAVTPPLSWPIFPLVTVGTESLSVQVVAKSVAVPYFYLKSLNNTTNIWTEAPNYVSPSLASGAIIYKVTYFTLDSLHYMFVVSGTPAGTSLSNLIIQFDPVLCVILGEISGLPTSSNNANAAIYSADNVLISTTGTTVARFVTIPAESTGVLTMALNTILVTFTGALAATATNIKTPLATLRANADSVLANAGQGVRCIMSGANKLFVVTSGAGGFVDVYNINYTGVAPALYGTGLNLVGIAAVDFVTAIESTSVTGYIIIMYTFNNSVVVSTYNRYSTGVFIGCVNVTGVTTPVIVFASTTRSIALPSLSTAATNSNVLHTSLVRYASAVSNFDTFMAVFSESNVSGATANLFYATFTINVTAAPVFGAFKDFMTLIANNILNMNSTINYQINKFLVLLSNGRMLVTYCDTTNGNNIYTKIIQIGTQTLDVSNAIGVCQAVTANGAPAPIALLGQRSVAPSYLGTLTQGANYYIQPLGNISTTVSQHLLGKAISGSNLLLSNFIGLNTSYFRTAPSSTVVVSAGAGTGATATITGNGYGGTVVLQTGTAPAAGQFFRVNFASALPFEPSTVVTVGQVAAASPASGAIGLDLFSGIGNACFIVRGSAALTASTTYTFAYSINY